MSTKHFCDRCKKELPVNVFYLMNNPFCIKNLRIELCADCHQIAWDWWASFGIEFNT
jgi:hypothetical protein